MGIISKTIKIEAQIPVDNEFIEKKLKESGITALRWAIVKTDANVLTISVACYDL